MGGSWVVSNLPESPLNSVITILPVNVQAPCQVQSAEVQEASFGLAHFEYDAASQEHYGFRTNPWNSSKVMPTLGPRAYE